MLEGRAAIAAAVHADLVDRLGRTRVFGGDDAKRLCGIDPAVREGPLALVRPATTEHVEWIVKVGRQRHAQLMPRMRLPVSQPDEVRDTLVVDLAGLQRPAAVDIGRRTVTVGVGVDVVQIDRLARQARLCLRALPAFGDTEKVGWLLARGDPGELGLGGGSLLDDVVGAEVVTGGGRALHLGAADLLGCAPWLAAGLGQPLGQLLGSEGRLAILCEVTLRLHPAGEVSWISSELPADREALLAAASAARQAQSASLCDTALVVETAGAASLHLRVQAAGQEALARHVAALRTLGQRFGFQLGDATAESRRARLGMEASAWPRPAPVGHALDWRVPWPDVASVWDLTAALYADAGEAPGRIWAFGADGVRLRCLIATRPDTHPLVVRAGLLMDAGAVPIGVGSLLRTAARDRLPTSSKVLLAALQRAWDPESVLAVRTGIG